jgi:hypothetical protein
MDSMPTQTYRLRPIDPAAADALRALGGPVHVATEHPGYPCRQCLRDTEVGDQLLLVSHDPFTLDTPYRSASPIFLHREPCVPPEDLHQLPAQLTERQLSVRSFDPEEIMIDATVIDGHHLQATIERFFTAQQSHSIHVHNATRGCWAVTIERT